MSSVPDHLHLLALNHSQWRWRIFRALTKPSEHRFAVSRFEKNHIEQSVIGRCMECERESRPREAEVKDLDKQKLSSEFFPVDIKLKQFRLSVLHKVLQILTRHIESDGRGRPWSAPRNTLSDRAYAH